MSTQELVSRILQVFELKPGLLGREVADRIGIDRKQVNGLLFRPLRDSLYQGITSIAGTRASRRLGLYAQYAQPLQRRHYTGAGYGLDFALFKDERKLNIEIDGERYHRSWTGELCRRDQMRNQRLFELGWGVKRFWVYEVRDDLNRCIQDIKN